MERCCELRHKLAIEFSTSARLYAEIVVQIAVAAASQERYFHLRTMAEEAQNRAEAAFVAFEEHVESHRCFNGYPQRADFQEHERLMNLSGTGEHA